MKISSWGRAVQLAIAVTTVALSLATVARADTLIATQTNNYLFGGNPIAVVIQSNVHNHGATYLWEYIVTNNSYNPDSGFPGLPNGFSGFELALPLFVPDLANVTSPGPGWVINCCSGLPMEWDINNSAGLGIMPGNSGTFSFTSLPRLITTATNGWFHTWESNVQTSIVNYGAANAPLAPNVVAPPIPEPGTLSLLGIGGLLLAQRLRRKRRVSRL